MHSLPVPEPHSQTLRDATKPSLSYLSRIIGTKYNFGPISSKAEWSALRSVIHALGADNFDARPPLNQITKALNLRANDACGQTEIKYHLPAHVAQAWASMKSASERRDLRAAHEDLAGVDELQRDSVVIGAALTRDSMGELDGNNTMGKR